MFFVACISVIVERGRMVQGMQNLAQLVHEEGRLDMPELRQPQLLLKGGLRPLQGWQAAVEVIVAGLGVAASRRLGVLLAWNCE